MNFHYLEDVLFTAEPDNQLRATRLACARQHSPKKWEEREKSVAGGVGRKIPFSSERFMINLNAINAKKKVVSDRNANKNVALRQKLSNMYEKFTEKREIHEKIFAVFCRLFILRMGQTKFVLCSTVFQYFYSFPPFSFGLEI